MGNLPKTTNFTPSATTPTSYQPYLHTSTQNSSISGQNTSIDSSFKQQEKSVPSFLTVQKQFANNNSNNIKNIVNNYGSLSMGTLNHQNRPIIGMVTPNIQPQPGIQNANMWKKN